MGVTGLWRLIEPAGKPVPVETLENKVLAIDISIWLHQMVKGYQDAKGAPLPNAHLMGLFQRLCKLLYFRIKPVFVFDGAFPDLKKETIAKRQDNKNKNNSESEQLKRQLALILGKKTAVSGLLGKQISPKKAATINNQNDDDIFKLPALPEKEESETETSDDEDESSGSTVDLHSIDIESGEFKNLPVKEKYDLLLELKETRKMNSWGKLHTLPKKSDSFSEFQMARLLKRRKVQECLQETEKVMGDVGMSLNDLESLLNEEGIDTKMDSLPTRRIASDNSTRILLINNVKQAFEDAKKKLESESKQVEDRDGNNKENPTSSKKTELEDDLEAAIKMSLECHDVDTSVGTSKTDESWTSFMTDSDYSDSEEADGCEQPDMSSAKAYIMQYSDLTYKAIDSIVVRNKKNYKEKSKVPNVDQIIEDLNNENTIIGDKVELSSDDDNVEEKCDINNHDIDVNICSDSGEPNEGDQSQEISEINTSTDKSINDQKIYEINTSTYKSINDQEINEINTSTDKNKSINDEIDTAQSSVICIDNPKDVITIDTSIENDEEVKVKMEQTESIQCKNESRIIIEDESDDDFEEVLDDESETKPVVQLTLKFDKKSLEDDIFADIFTSNTVINTSKKDVKSEVIKSNDLDIYENPTPSTSNVDKLANIDITKPNRNIDFKSDEKTEITFTTIKPKPNKISVNLGEDELDETLPNHQIETETVLKTKDNITKEIENTEVSADKVFETERPSKEISIEKLTTMAEELENEEALLLNEKHRLERFGRNVTEQMTKEAQELLQLFGIPYIVAPMEAEAQCAFLESAKLTDGTITDDSDIWLFGGRTVYKNFFNQKKHVLQFLAERIERSFNLTREQLILLALLVGSDYTTGVTGVGPVTAMEILASFPFNKKQFLNETSNQGKYSQVITGLQEFKKWVRAGKRTDNTTLKKKLKNVALTEDFPSIKVIQAYMEPNVHRSEENFTWGEIDVTMLRGYVREKFGWSQHKLDEIIKPVLARILDRKNQRNIQDYFKKKIEFQSLEEHMSKRVKAAVQRMGPDGKVVEDQSKPIEQKSKIVRKRKNKDANRCDKDNILSKGPSKAKQKKNNEDNVLNSQCVRAVSEIETGKTTIEITIPKTDRVQEIIPQREKEKQSLLENKMKAIEIFRKANIDRKKKPFKKRVIKPKDKAELSESSDSD